MDPELQKAIDEEVAALSGGSAEGSDDDLMTPEGRGEQPPRSGAIGEQPLEIAREDGQRQPYTEPGTFVLPELPSRRESMQIGQAIGELPPEPTPEEQEYYVRLGRAQAAGDASAQYEAMQWAKSKGIKIDNETGEITEPVNAPKLTKEKPVAEAVTYDSSEMTEDEEYKPAPTPIDEGYEAFSELWEKQLEELSSIGGQIEGAEQNIGRLKSRLNDASEQYMGEKVDPSRWWKNKSTLGKAVTILGTIMSGFAEGFSRGRIKSQALQVINGAVDRDIRLQLEEIKRKGSAVDTSRNLLAAQFKELGDLRAAHLNTKRIMASMLKDRAKEEAPLKQLSPKEAEDIASDAALIRSSVDLFNDIENVGSITTWDQLKSKFGGIFGDEKSALSRRVESWARQMGRAAGVDVGNLALKEGEILVKAVTGDNWEKVPDMLKNMRNIVNQAAETYESKLDMLRGGYDLSSVPSIRGTVGELGKGSPVSQRRGKRGILGKKEAQKPGPLAKAGGELAGSVDLKRVERMGKAAGQTWKRGSVERWAPFVRSSSEEYGVPEALAWAVMNKESSGDPKARSNVGAIGLMQLMPQYHEEFAKQAGLPAGADLSDPQNNVKAGVALLSRLIDKYDGDLHKALQAYNGGPGLVGKSKQTKLYADRVLKRMGLLGG